MEPISAVRLVITVEDQWQQIELSRTGGGCPAEPWLVAPPTVPMVDCAWQGSPFPSTRLAPGHIPTFFVAGSSALDHRPLMFRPLTQNITWWRASEQGHLPDTLCSFNLFWCSLNMTYLVCLAWAASSASSLLILLSPSQSQILEQA